MACFKKNVFRVQKKARIERQMLKMQKADKLTFINRADRKVIPSHKTLPMPILSQMTFRSNLTTSSYNSQTVCFGHLDCHSGTEKPYHAFLS